MRYGLIDADIVAFKAASVCEEVSAFDDTTVVTDYKEACALVDDFIESYTDECDCDVALVCLTDPVNFRKELNPTYKSNRTGAYKPELLGPLKKYMEKEYRTYQRPGLEADDCMGILATGDYLDRHVGHPVDKVIISEDKDMRTIPAKVWSPRHTVGILEISELDADRFLMWQTVCGDPTDGYPGAPGIGPVKAEEILGADREELWDMVVDLFDRVGQTEEDAIMQARMARILRSCDWDNKKKQVRLWTPDLLWKSMT